MKDQVEGDQMQDIETLQELIAMGLINSADVMGKLYQLDTQSASTQVSKVPQDIMLKWAKSLKRIKKRAKVY